MVITRGKKPDAARGAEERKKNMQIISNAQAAAKNTTTTNLVRHPRYRPTQVPALAEHSGADGRQWTELDPDLANNSSKLKEACKVAGDAGLLKAAIKRISPYANERSAATAQSRLNAYARILTSAGATPFPVTVKKLEIFLAALCAAGYRTADDYVASVKGAAATFGALEWQAGDSEYINRIMTKCRALGDFDHEQSAPVTLEDIYHYCCGGTTSGAVIDPTAATGLLAFYFALRCEEKRFLTPARLTGPETGVFRLSMENARTKGRLIKVVVCYCVCDQLDKLGAAEVCICHAARAAMAGEFDPTQIAWPDVITKFSGPQHKPTSHGFRVGCLISLLANETAIGLTNIACHLRWASEGMIRYYARMRHWVTTAWAINSITPPALRHQEHHSNMLEKIDRELTALRADINEAFFACDWEERVGLRATAQAQFNEEFRNGDPGLLDPSRETWLTTVIGKAAAESEREEDGGTWLPDSDPMYDGVATTHAGDETPAGASPFDD